MTNDVQSTPYAAERLAAEATGDFYCEGEQVRSSLKCQRPCDDCWKRHGWTNTPKVPEGPLTREEAQGPEGVRLVEIPTDKEGLIEWLNANFTTDNG